MVLTYSSAYQDTDQSSLVDEFVSGADDGDKGLPIRAITRSIAVLQAVNRMGSLSMTDIAAAARLPYPTACRIVATLVHEGLIERESSRKRYRPTALVQTLSCGFQGHGRLIQIARPHIVELTRKIGWPVSLVTRVGHSVVIRDSTHALTSLTYNNYFPGFSMPLLDSASGRVMLAFASSEDREFILSGLSALPGRSDMHVLRLFRSGEMVEEIRVNGYATMSRNPHTANPGKTSSISVPIFEGEAVIGALTGIFFAATLKLQDAIATLVPELKSAAARISDEQVV